MDVVVNLQALGAPAVAVGGISLLLIKRFVDHNWSSPPDLPPLPGIYRYTLLIFLQIIYSMHCNAKYLYVTVWLQRYQGYRWLEICCSWRRRNHTRLSQSGLSHMALFTLLKLALLIWLCSILMMWPKR